MGEHPSSDGCPPLWLCIDLAGIGDIDYSAGQTLLSLGEQIREWDTRLVFAEVDEDVRRELDRFGITDLVGDHAFFDTVGDVVSAFRGRTGGTG